MRFVLLAMTFVAACANRAANVPTSPTNQRVAAAHAETIAVAPTRLGITPLKVYLNGEVILTMREDGAVTLAGQTAPVFTVHADGTMRTHLGPSGRLDADGRIVRPDGSVSQAVLDGEVLKLGGRNLRVDEDGVVQIDGPVMDGEPPRVEGIVDRPTRRTALMLVGLMLEAAFTPQGRTPAT